MVQHAGTPLRGRARCGELLRCCAPDLSVSIATDSSLILSFQPERQPEHFDGVFTLPPQDPPKKIEKDEEKKIKGVLERLRQYGIENITEANIEYALRSQPSQGDPEAAFRMLMMLEDTYEGIMKPYDPNMKLLGSVNRDSVTCYLDSLLFAMFSKLDSFEAMLYENFDDLKRKRLAGLLRLWVNMLRSGRLITVDITEHIQRALADCGWKDAARVRQQDPSEAFTFITAQLELPMLTLKMDMYHTGKEDPQDDHKFINERLLEVAILDEAPDGRDVITLEDCLEHYFNNRIEVKRHMENQRRNTLKSANFAEGATKVDKEPGVHVEVAEVGPETPLAQSPAMLTPMVETPTPPSRLEQLRPGLGRKRADSIFSQRKVELIGIDPNDLSRVETSGTMDSQGRKLSTRTEVLMPAWQFFKLLPWYTDHMPTSDVQVAAHFSKKRPVLGICLKRYSYTNSGQARRLDTYVDIPLEIAVPNFVSDDTMQEDGPLVGNFRLALQSVVCHRGVSVHSGHYICLARGREGKALRRQNTAAEQAAASDDGEVEDPWMRFDDLAAERIAPVDIHEALRKETPYLLFYQVLPIGDDGHSIHDLPSYTEATSRSQSDAAPPEKPLLSSPDPSSTHLEQVVSEPTAAVRASTEALDFVSPTSERVSLDMNRTLDRSRGRTGAPSEASDTRRKSITFDASSISGGSALTDPATSSLPSTPSEEKDKGNSFLAVANKFSGSRRGSRQSKGNGSTRSRPTSTGPDSGGNRFSLNMSKLTQRMSNANNKDGAGDSKLSGSTSVEDVDIKIQPSEHVAAELAGQTDAAPAYETSQATHTERLPMGATSANVSKESVSALAINTSVGKGNSAVGAGTKLKKDKERATAKGSKKGSKAEDRECVLM